MRRWRGAAVLHWVRFIGMHYVGAILFTPHEWRQMRTEVEAICGIVYSRPDIPHQNFLIAGTPCIMSGI